MSLPGLIDLIHELEQVFDRLRIDRSYGDAIACNYYAPPRFTQDVDVLILAPATRMPGLVEELSSIGCTETFHPSAPPVQLQRILTELRAKPYWTVLYCHGIRIEFFAPWHSFHHRVLERSPSRQLEGRAIRIHSAEDLIIFKKIFDRPKDIIDIKAMLLAQKGRLDLERLRLDAKTLLTDSSLDELNRLISDFG